MLKGTAFMIMWHDIAEEREQEYHHWHSKQHMPERLDHAGFLRSRRGVNWDFDWQRYFTLYEGRNLDAFVADDYQASLNHPTAWTTSMAPHFRNFLRCACEVAYTSGRGVGGGLITLRGRFGEGLPEADFCASITPALDALGQQPLINAVHLGVARPNYSGAPTKETELRPKMNEAAFDFVVIVESYGIRELEQLQQMLAAEITSHRAVDLVAQEYATALMLEKA